MRRYIAIASAMMLTLSAAAQNLNPTVQVTNAYDGKLMDISKKTIAMNVPDSLFKFDWNFNYSVFDNPYKGAYEFNPYVIDMRPDPVAYDGTRLYVRAGAGYTLHPEAQVVWNPMLKGRFGLSVYDDFKGYFGNYTDVAKSTIEKGSYELAKGDAAKGSDMSNRLGAVLRYDLPKAILTFDTGLDFIMTGASDAASCVNSPLLVANTALANQNVFRARSNNPESPFFYDATGHFNVTSDACSVAPGADKNRYTELNFGGAGRGGYNFTANHGVAIDVDVDRYTQSAAALPNATMVEFTPMYNLSLDRLHVEAGIRLSKLWRSENVLSETVADDDAYSFPDYHGRLLYPHVKADYELVDDALVVFAGVTGGQKYNSYASYLSNDHRFAIRTSDPYCVGLSNATVNTFDASLGFSGRIAHKLQYKIDGGYARMYNAPMEGLDALNLESPLKFCYDMVNYDLLYGDVEAAWTSDRLDASADMRLQKTDFRSFKYAANLPAFSGAAQIRYNWNKRIYAGISAEWATRRKVNGDEVALNSDLSVSAEGVMRSYTCKIPGWVDLGLTADYRINSKFTVWAEGGNLLNQMVMRNLMVAERGPYFTLGLSFNL